MRIFIILTYCLFCVLSIHAQEHEHTHEHARNEIGISGGPLYASKHKEWGIGVHLHYFRTLSLHSKWSLGGSLEQAWVDGNHFNMSAGVKYQLLDKMSIAALPGVTFFSHNATDIHDTNKSQRLLALHFEWVYDLFHWDNFHIGTVIDYSWTKTDPHIMAGVHAAFCF